MNVFKKFTLSLITIILLLNLCACSAAGSQVQSESPVVSQPPAQESTVSPEPEETPEPEPEPEEILPVTIEILGKEYDENETFLDLSDMHPEDIAEISGKMAEMPQLSEVNLMPEDGEPLLSLPAVCTLKEALPGVHFDYGFDLYEQHLTTEDTEVSFVKAEIGNEGEESIRQALTVLDKCEYFLLDDCGIDDEIMAQIREDFPDTKVVWRVHVGWKSALTDDQVIRMTHGINGSLKILQ